MNALPQPILLIGYTARMLAELAVRAGYAVTALDYFGDSDLRALGPGRSLLRDFADKAYSPRALVAASRQVEAPSVVYGASFENHPELVEALSTRRLLLGNTPATLRRVRDPFELAQVLRADGFVFPQTYGASAPPAPQPRRWLWKPTRGGGGTHVRWVTDAIAREGIVQEFVAGMVGSFTFIANGRESIVVGVSEQLMGLPEFGAQDFRWCGNLSPPRLPDDDVRRIWDQAHDIARCLTSAFGLRGANGVDFVWRDQRIWTIEVNPRPSAALELFDAQYDTRLFDWHVRACLQQAWPDKVFAMPDHAVGKAVVFAASDLVVGDTQHWHAQGIRDVPHPHEAVQRGHPICTVLARAATPEQCLTQLRAKADLVRQSSA